MANQTPKEQQVFGEAAALIAEAERDGRTTLDLSQYSLTQIPPTIGRLTQLLELDLSTNRLAAVPDSIRKLINLQKLDLVNNRLKTVPDWLGELTQLQALHLFSNQVTSLPNSIGQLTRLQELYLDRNQLTTLPNTFGNLAHLQELNIGSNPLTTIPDWLPKLSHLRILGLYDLRLRELPEFLAQLTQLQELYLSFNRLSILPDWISNLAQIKVLLLDANLLTTLPDSLKQLHQLQFLDLRQNQLTLVPDVIRRLSQLETLYLNENRLTSLPRWLVELSKLENLFVYGNYIAQPPPEQLGEALSMAGPVNLEAVRRYYDQLQREGQAYFYEAKLLLIGEGGAGKTSLAAKLIDETASLPGPDDSTDGISILTWNFPIEAAYLFNYQSPITDNPNYQANIWDFGGQSIYHATHQFFLSKRSVYVLVADTRRQHTDFFDWLRMQEAFGADSPVLLLKNKNRQHGNQFVIENLSHLQERFPNLDKIIELDLSNVPDEESWQEVQGYLKKRLMSLDHIGVPRPKTWVEVRQALRDDSRDSISRREFLKLCRSHNISDEQDALQLSDYLHHVGDILHFEEDPILADLVILKPTWALDAVYRVLDDPITAANWGQFTRQHLRQLWHEAKYENHREQLLRLMQNFKLCYQFRYTTDTFIAPQLLKVEKPADYQWSGGPDDLQIRYRYPIFMPRGILSRAIVSLHHRIEDQWYAWRTGIVLRDNFARAELLELPVEREIRIRVTGTNKRDLLMEIVRNLDDLHQGFSGRLKYDKLVACRCETCQLLSDPHFYRLGKLLERLSHGKATVECDNPPYEEVQIRSLIDDAIIRQEQQTSRIHHGDIYNINMSDIEGSAINLGRSGSATTNK